MSRRVSWMMCVTVAQPGGAFWFVATMINGPGRRGGILTRDAKPAASEAFRRGTVLPSLRAGGLGLFVARQGAAIAGTVQLDYDTCLFILRRRTACADPSC
ncbi:hypothetical protein LMG28614_02602 [Paraburkholderia ultramafica]|uniref:Uncharacterized protein n=1 Tax=Paraburkholderia ultramafica TaxID=1544867 RepID=A0A6S7CTW8_9BURK|nr:hypothetical protein LMG28614_02602 [Paraburkholderia ultramafica]